MAIEGRAAIDRLERAPGFVSRFTMTNVTELQPAARREVAADSPCAACNVRHLAVCSSLHGEDLRRMTDILHHTGMAADDTLFGEGERAENVYNVTSGCLKLYKLLPDGRRQVTGFLFPGDFLGLADSEDYIYSAEAVTEVLLCKFQRRKLERLMEEIPSLEKRLLGIARHEIVEAQNQILLLGRKTAKERIASFILMLSQRAAERGEPDNPVHLPMSRNDIGDYLGLTTETVSRTLTRLRGSGFVTLSNDRDVTIADREALDDLASGF